MDELRQRLDAAVTRRDRVARNVERLQGRLESAQKALEKVESEIRSKGVEPQDLDDTIAKVEKKLLGIVTQLEQQVEQSEREIAPYLGDNIL